MDRAESSTVSDSYILVQALESICTAEVTEFLVKGFFEFLWICRIYSISFETQRIDFLTL